MTPHLKLRSRRAAAPRQRRVLGTGQRDAGSTLVLLMVVTALCISLLTSLAGWTILSLKAAKKTLYGEQALLLAEAGAEYYRWHLAHYPADFKDGTTGAGPYVHTVKDASNVTLGTYSLTITAPLSGSTLVTIKSVGSPAGSPATRRAVEAKLGKPSWAKFAVVANDVMRFGTGTEVFGQIHSNDGIRFDGLTHNLITSAKTTYDDPDHSGGSEHAVHTHVTTVDPLPPTAPPARADVFEAGRVFPVPAVDFDGITADLSSIKSLAQSGGKYFAASGSLGYLLQFKTNDTYDMYRVTSTTAVPSGCGNDQSEDNWGTWSVGNKTALSPLNYAMPANGLIFVEDNLWVEGTIASARVTIAAARFPESTSTYRNITVNNDLKYTNYDGQDVIALIAQDNFNVGLFSEDDLRIDAAIMAQKGRAGRHYYNSGDCGTSSIRDALTLFGMIGTDIRYGFAWNNGATLSSGYADRSLNYDSHLLYAPPPNFPLTSDSYQFVSWREVSP